MARKHGPITPITTLMVAGACVALACGGTTDMSACRASEATLGPYLVPYGSTFDVAYGTAYTQSWIGGLDLNVVLTRDPNGCPTSWLTSGKPVAQDTDLLWLSLPAPGNGSLPATYWATPNAGVPPFALAATVGQGHTYDLNGGTAWSNQPSGTVTISLYVPGSEVAGSFDVTFDSGQSVSGDFDVPFCACPNQ